MNSGSLSQNRISANIQPGLVRRHHLHLGPGEMARPCVSHESLRSPSGGLGVISKAGCRLGDQSIGRGLRAAWQAARPAISLRPGIAIWQPQLSPAAVALSHASEYEPPRKLLGYAPMERVFRSLKTEWIPTTDYTTCHQAQRDISQYLTHYYNWIRPHQYNDGLARAKTEEKAQNRVWDQLSTTGPSFQEL